MAGEGSSSDATWLDPPTIGLAIGEQRTYDCAFEGQRCVRPRPAADPTPGCLTPVYGSRALAKITKGTTEQQPRSSNQSESEDAV